MTQQTLAEATKDGAPTVDPRIRDVLTGVFDPCCRDKGISVVDMGLLHRAEISGSRARVELLLTSGWCPFASQVLTDIEAAVVGLEDVAEAAVEIVWDEVWGSERLSASARSKLTFLPEPAAVPDPTNYVAANWPNHEGEQR
ncbi:metal-sulfur cluster assembly factor [Nocardioides limicola]|uniref:metal-sulfur cluster assembly factor n=1 Tax=Nocardioides limicola TaxID=2803368 RepID=UPI00193B1B5C|nr:iron-sulfur cluster assembly protein [Nocardioides sp. DJM-14]